MRGDKLFLFLVSFFALLIVLLFVLFFHQLLCNSIPTWKRFGLSFVFGKSWNPLRNDFGALPFLYGTILTSTLSLLISVVLSLGIAVFLSEMAPPRLRDVLSSLIELIAAIPSVIIGLWGIFYVAPFVRDHLQYWLEPLSFIPLFSGRSLTGLSMLTAIIILTFMITPIISSIMKESLMMVPEDLKEALYSLGARRYEVMMKVCIPYAKVGILGGVILGYGRAVGETMAVTMVIGNSPVISASLLSPGYTMAAVIANEFTEATGDLHLSSLIAVAFILLVVSLSMNLIGRAVIWKWQKQSL